MAIWTSEIKELERLHESFKGQLPDLEKELERLVKADDENMILLYSRRCLEVIITDLCECQLKRERGTEPLKGIIDKLNKEKKVPSHIITSMHGLNDLSTYGTHPKDFDPEQIKPVLVNLDIIIKWYLNYKETGKDIKAKPNEGITQGIKSTVDVKKSIQIPKKRLAGILGGLIAIIASVFAVLFISKIIGDNKQTQVLEKSIAVLPFINNSSDSTNQYFIDGTMEAILDKLCKIGDLTVISRTSVEQFRNTIEPIREIAKRLNVNYILEGSGQKYENNIRLDVQLIDATKDKHIWSYPYEGEAKDIFKLESQIAELIAAELKAIITPEEKQRIEKKPTKNLDAYNFYLLGKFYINQNFEESLKEGIKCFEHAIKLDPEYAMAYIGLAQCYQFLVRYSGMTNEEGYPKAKQAVLKAIELDESLGEAYSALGLIKIVFDRDIYGPEQEFQKAIKLSPNSAEVCSSYAQYLRWLGRYDEGAKIAKRAIELDPLTPLTKFWLGAIYFYAGRYDESIDYFKKMLSMDSNYVHTYSYLAYNYTLKGSYSNAIYYADKALSFEEIRNSPLYLSPLGWVYAKAGEINKAKEILTQVEELRINMNSDLISVAMIYVGLGEREKAFDLLFKAYKVHSSQTIYLKVMGDCWFKEISSDPRYIDLLKKIGFTTD
jgi:TolB-like protein/Flp pilus assembly protein TadD